MSLYKLCLVVLFLACAPTFAAESPLQGFHHVSGTIFRGGRPRNANELRWLKQNGIRTIINLQGMGWKTLPGESPESIAEARAASTAMGFRYLQLPFPAAKQLAPADEKVIVRAAQLLADPAAQPVYVHCNVGADRTGVVVAAYRVLYQGCSLDAAAEELYSYGHPFTQMFVSSQLKFVKTLEAHRVVQGAHCPL